MQTSQWYPCHQSALMHYIRMRYESWQMGFSANMTKFLFFFTGRHHITSEDYIYIHIYTFMMNFTHFLITVYRAARTISFCVAQQKQNGVWNEAWMSSLKQTYKYHLIYTSLSDIQYSYTPAYEIVESTQSPAPLILMQRFQSFLIMFQRIDCTNSHHCAWISNRLRSF